MSRCGPFTRAFCWSLVHDFWVWGCLPGRSCLGQWVSGSSYGFPVVFHLAYGDHAGGIRYVVEYFPDSFIFDMLLPHFLEYVDFEDASDAAMPENIVLHLVGFL